MFVFFFLLIRQPPTSTLFPFTTLFRSSRAAGDARRKGPHRLDRAARPRRCGPLDRKSTRLNSSHVSISYAVFCLKKKKSNARPHQPLSPVHLYAPYRVHPLELYHSATA